MLVARTVAVALAIVVSSSASAWAQGKTDVITLLNRDRITGEIVELARGRLELKTDDAGTLAIEWDKIASIQAARQWSACDSSTPIARRSSSAPGWSATTNAASTPTRRRTSKARSA